MEGGERCWRTTVSEIGGGGIPGSRGDADPATELPIIDLHRPWLAPSGAWAPKCGV